MSRIAASLIALMLVTTACAGDGGVAASTGTPPTVAATTSSTSTSTSTSGGGGTTADTSTTLPPTTAVEPTAPLPPPTFEELKPLLDPLVAPLGMAVTRASLIELENFTVTADGTHLAVYVVADRERDPDEFARALASVAAVFLPEVFQRWPGLESFDVCQEPFGWDEESTAPSITILDISRSAVGAIDWTDAELSDLIAAGATDDGLTIFADAEVRSTETWDQAITDAGL